MYWGGCVGSVQGMYLLLRHCEMNSIIVCGNTFELPFMTSHIQW